MSCLPKPVLRGHIKRRGVKGLIGAFVLAAINGTLYHCLVAIPRKNAYDEFLRDYDMEEHYKNLVKWHYCEPCSENSKDSKASK